MPYLYLCQLIENAEIINILKISAIYFLSAFLETNKNFKSVKYDDVAFLAKSHCSFFEKMITILVPNFWQ